MLLRQHRLPEKENFHQKKREYLLNRKPERYKLYNLGEGFLIIDTLRIENNEDKEGYMLIPDFLSSKSFRVDDRFFNPEELVCELNRLDFKVNGGLYDDYYHVLSNKERIYQYIECKLDDLLDTVVTNEKFKVCLTDYPSKELLEIEVNVYRSGLRDIGGDNSPFTDNMIFSMMMKTINWYLDELEDTDNSDDIIREDTLIELKKRLLENINFKNLFG